jgi:murein L,D-transpeptidase YcbB/YkuD
MGLKQNGQVRGATLTALNIAADVRARQLAATYKRMSGINFAFGDRYIVVNIPSAAVEAVEKGRVAHRYIAVVGDVDHPSPEITARVQAVNLNPTWTVPTSIIKNEIIPKMRKDPAYLKRMKIRIFDSAGKEINPIAINWTGQSAVNYTLRQDSGAGNSLGNIRINMPNTQAVYMHDTPSKKFFGRDYRFLSHGCVRVADVFDFAQWILEGTSTGSKGSTWDKASLRAKADGGERTDIKLASAIPVIWTYMTGWVSEDGIVHFRDDVYGKDNDPAVQALR